MGLSLDAIMASVKFAEAEADAARAEVEACIDRNVYGDLIRHRLPATTVGACRGDPSATEVVGWSKVRGGWPRKKTVNFTSPRYVAAKVALKRARARLASATRPERALRREVDAAESAAHDYDYWRYQASPDEVAKLASLCRLVIEADLQDSELAWHLAGVLRDPDEADRDWFREAVYSVRRNKQLGGSASKTARKEGWSYALIRACVAAKRRHEETNYDYLLSLGYDRDTAREMAE